MHRHSRLVLEQDDQLFADMDQRDLLVGHRAQIELDLLVVAQFERHGLIGLRLDDLDDTRRPGSCPGGGACLRYDNPRVHDAILEEETLPYPRFNLFLTLLFGQQNGANQARFFAAVVKLHSALWLSCTQRLIPPRHDPGSVTALAGKAHQRGRKSALPRESITVARTTRPFR